MRLMALLVSLAAALPLFGAVAADVTLPVAGYLDLPHVEYSTELMLTNHRDALQYVQIDFIQDGRQAHVRGFALQPRESKFLPQVFAGGAGMSNKIGALRIRAVKDLELDEPESDPQGQIEANAYIVAEWAGRNGSSRQEVAGIPSDEYHAREAVFLGVRHSASGAYTNVGVVNMHPTETEKFYIHLQYQQPFAIDVPPLSLIQVRLPTPGSGARAVRVYPEWSLLDDPTRTTPWVAYASTVDNRSGDAYSGMRVPAAARYEIP